MLSFEMWLEEKRPFNVLFAVWGGDGTVVVYINGKRYKYLTDPIYHDRWRRMEKYAPGRVLNEIKKQVKEGRAELLEPRPSEVAS